MMRVDEKVRERPRQPAGTPPGERAMSASAQVPDAYRQCEVITRRRAANFYYGIRLLPAEKRRAMSAVYAFARRVDDIGDGPLAPEHKLRQLEEQARALEQLAQPVSVPGAPADPVMAALADASARFELPIDALGELIEGVRMDVAGTSYERFEDLLLYCRRVAGAIGRLCLAVFGARAERMSDGGEAGALADDLGVALQLTNILRDVREDAENGRVYLPAEDLRAFGLISADGTSVPAVLASLAGAVSARGDASGSAGARSANGSGAAPAAADAGGQLAALVRFEAERAQQWFEHGIALVEVLDRRSAACVLAMAGIYQRLLERVAADPERALAQRVALAPWEKAWVAAASMLAAEPRVRHRRAAMHRAVGRAG
jgi:15-cis-phytoene synthase